MPDEYRLDCQLRQLSKMLPLTSNVVDTDHFLSKRLELKDFFSGKKRYLMESFYSLLETNARMKMMYRVWDRMQKTEKKEILKQALNYQNNLENL